MTRLLGSATALITALFAFSGCSNSPASGSTESPPPSAPPAKTPAAPAVKKEKITIKGNTFELEVAADAKSREQGLMHRDHIPDHGGMLFIFPDALVNVQSFWMKNCLIDMDIIYLDRRGTVTATHRMKKEEPQRPNETVAQYEARLKGYSSGYPAQFAIELQTGWLDKLKLNVDDRIELDLPRLKKMAR